MVATSNPVVIIDPTDEREPIKRSLAKRPEHISGTLGLLDISKPRGDKFIDRLEQLINEQMSAVFVATDKFVDSAAVQSISLGLSEVPQV